MLQMHFRPGSAKLLIYCVLRSTQPSTVTGKWVVAYGLRGEGLVWLIGALVCLFAANRGSNCSLTRAIYGRIVRCGIISSCQSAATSEIVKALLFTSLSHVKSAVASIKLYQSARRRSAGYIGWVTPQFRMYNSTFDMKKIRNVVVCSLDMENQIKSRSV